MISIVLWRVAQKENKHLVCWGATYFHFTQFVAPLCVLTFLESFVSQSLLCITFIFDVHKWKVLRCKYFITHADAAKIGATAKYLDEYRQKKEDFKFWKKCVMYFAIK